MTIEEFKAKYENIKKGAYTHIVYASGKNGYKKTTSTTIRFVDYYNIKEVKESGAKPSTTPNPNVETIIPHVLTYNKKTGNYLVHLYPTKNHKSHCVYELNGIEISKEEYELANPPKKSSSPVYQVVLTNVISLG